MLTLKQLYSKTTPERKDRARFVRIIQTKIGHNKQGLGYVAARTYSRMKVGADGRLVKNEDPQHYVTVITFLNKKLQCIVSCSCFDNTMRWEFSNTQKGASEIEYSNGEPPVVTNPRQIVGMCKHLCKLYNTIQPRLPPGY
jgi:hypothetical protein